MTPFPHTYHVTLAHAGGPHAAVAAPPRPSLLVGPPPEFGGDAEVWSPEHLLVSAANACLWATFKALAARRKLLIRAYHSEAEGTLDRTPDGLRFTRVDVRVHLEVDEADVALAGQLLHDAKQGCIVSSSLRCPVTLAADVRGARADEARAVP